VLVTGLCRSSNNHLGELLGLIDTEPCWGNQPDRKAVVEMQRFAVDLHRKQGLGPLGKILRHCRRSIPSTKSGLFLQRHHV